MKDEFTKPKFLSVPDAAKLCGVSRNTMYLWVRNGEVKAYQTPGRTNLIRPSDLVAFMKLNGMFIPSELANAAREDEKIKADSPEAMSQENEPHVLVVDDEPHVRTLIVRFLRDICPTYQAETGYEAMHLLTMHDNIRVVLLDLRMPGIHGVDTLKEIKLKRPDVHVLIVTAYEGELPPKALQDGSIAGLIKKPFTIDQLQDAVSLLLGDRVTRSPSGKTHAGDSPAP